MKGKNAKSEVSIQAYVWYFLGLFATRLPGEKDLSFKTLQSVSSKSAGLIVAFDFALHGFLASHSVIKKHLSSVLQLSDEEMNKKSHIPFSY